MNNEIITRNVKIKIKIKEDIKTEKGTVCGGASS